MNIRIFFFFWIIAVGAFTFLVPPFQKPDEPAHFYRAMTLVNSQFVCSVSPTYRYFFLSQSVYDFPTQMQTNNIVMRPDVKFPIGLVKHTYPFRSDKSVTDAYRYCQLSFVSYIPFAISAFLSYPFDNLLITFFAMRASAAMLLICFAYIGFYFIPKRYKLLFLFFIANPMLIHQATAVSYDAIINSLILLVIPLWLRCMDDKKIQWKTVVLLFLSLGLMCIAKPGYYFLVGISLPVLTRIPIKKYSIPFVLCFLFCLTVGILYSSSIISIFSDFFSVSKAPQIYIVLHDPWYFFGVIGRTIIESHERLIEGMIGLFGWLDYRLPLYGMLVYTFVGGMIAYDYIRTQTKALRGWVILLLGILCLSTVLLIFYNFYRAATPAAYRVVESIQGRYFLPLLPFLTIMVLESVVWLKHRRRIVLLVVSCGVIAVGSISYSIFSRYYDFSKNFSNPDMLVKEVAEKRIDISSLTSIELNSHMSYQYNVLSPGYKIGGVQMIAENEIETDIPYRIFLKDATCTNILYQGYMNELRDVHIAHLKGDNDIVITQHLPIIPLAESSICLELEPVATYPHPVYLRLLGEHNKPVVRFLYIAK